VHHRRIVSSSAGNGGAGVSDKPPNANWWF
jgi:hypothetical protein